MDTERIIKALEACRKTRANSYQAKCPAHDDRKASLTITDAGDKILLHCHAGCTTQAIVNSMGLSMKDLFIEKKEKKMDILEKEYFYTDENGNNLYKAMRFYPKKFMQAKFFNNEWVFNMQNVRYVLYNLPNVIKSDTIYFVEGEKDADNLNKLGLTATTTIGGASGFNKHKEEYAEFLKDKTIYIIPDNDKSGITYAENIYKALYNITKKVQILYLVNEIQDLKLKSDISDVLAEFGKEKTLEIIENLKQKNYETKVFPIENIDNLNEKTFEYLLDYLGIKIKYNVITKRIIITGMPKKYATSDLYTILPIYLKNVLRNKGIKINDTKKIEEFITLEIAKNNFNPILDLFNNNKWDNIDRYEEICNIFNLNTQLDKTLLIKWLKQSVAMLFNTLDKPFGAEGILTLQGKQGIGKTRSLSLLSLNPEWFADGVVLDMNNKDSLIRATSHWLCELGEIEDTLKKEQSSLKGFITSPIDDIRAPYAKSSIRKPRNTSFCASVNSVSFLKDATGNRRFYVLHVEKIDYKKLENLGHNWILQLWLQAYDEVKKDLNCFRLTEEEQKLVMENNLKYTEFLPYEEELMSMIDFNSKDKTIWTNKDLLKLLPNTTAQAIGRVLNKIENNYPNVLKIKRTSKCVTYLLKIKDCYLNQNNVEM